MTNILHDSGELDIRFRSDICVCDANMQTVFTILSTQLVSPNRWGQADSICDIWLLRANSTGSFPSSVKSYLRA